MADQDRGDTTSDDLVRRGAHRPGPRVAVPVAGDHDQVDVVAPREMHDLLRRNALDHDRVDSVAHGRSRGEALKEVFEAGFRVGSLHGPVERVDTEAGTDPDPRDPRMSISFNRNCFVS